MPGSAGLAAVVLAAGAGTRLRPLSDIRPKALCPVANVPLVDWALQRAATVTPAVAVNVHSGRALMEAHLGGRVHLSLEPRLLGTAGALGRLRDWVGGRALVVTNADAWLPASLAPLVEDWDGERVRLLVVEDPRRGDFGRWRYAGASLMAWSEVRLLAAEPSGLYETTWGPRWEAGRLELVPTTAPFVDCGTPSDYLAANLQASGGASVIGPGATVEGQVVRSVVWPLGAVARGERLVESIRVGHDITVPAPLATLNERG